MNCFFYNVFYLVMCQGKADQLADYTKRLKLCIKWFQHVEEGHLLEEEKLRNALSSAEQKCTDTGNFVFLSVKLSGFVDNIMFT